MKFCLASLSIEPTGITYLRKYDTNIWLRHKGNDRVKEQRRDENDVLQCTLSSFDGRQKVKNVKSWQLYLSAKPEKEHPEATKPIQNIKILK